MLAELAARFKAGIWSNKRKRPAMPGALWWDAERQRYCGFACAETAFVEAITGCPFR
jgi:hypothetical protein